jgi:hypothetical protein
LVGGREGGGGPAAAQGLRRQHVEREVMCVWEGAGSYVLGEGHLPVAVSCGRRGPYYL